MSKSDRLTIAIAVNREAERQGCPDPEEAGIVKLIDWSLVGVDPYHYRAQGVFEAVEDVKSRHPNKFAPQRFGGTPPQAFPSGAPSLPGGGGFGRPSWNGRGPGGPGPRPGLRPDVDPEIRRAMLASGRYHKM